MCMGLPSNGQRRQFCGTILHLDRLPDGLRPLHDAFILKRSGSTWFNLEVSIDYSTWNIFNVHPLGTQVGSFDLTKQDWGRAGAGPRLVNQAHQFLQFLHVARRWPGKKNNCIQKSSPCHVFENWIHKSSCQAFLISAHRIVMFANTSDDECLAWFSKFGHDWPKSWMQAGDAILIRHWPSPWKRWAGQVG